MLSLSIAEAKCLGIPTFGLVDTNTDPFCLDYPIPANDDSIKTIKLITSHISDSILEAIGGSENKETTESIIDDKEQSSDNKIVDEVDDTSDESNNLEEVSVDDKNIIEK